MKKNLWLGFVVGVLLAEASACWGAESFSGVAGPLGLGMSARTLALGAAFVGLSDDLSALIDNAAGLAGLRDLHTLSSYERRLGTASYGHLSAAWLGFGFGVHYFDFGEIPLTDEYGNISGIFTYRNVALLLGAGLRLSSLPVMRHVPLADELSFGLLAKVLKVSTLDPGSGQGGALDVSFLFRSPSAFGHLVDNVGLGAVLQNALQMPMKYGSGHEEAWKRDLVVGGSVRLLRQVVLVMDLLPFRGALRLGAEWTPIWFIAVRGGLRNEGVWMASFGIGVRFQFFTLDYACVLHPYLTSQHRVSFGTAWSIGSSR